MQSHVSIHDKKNHAFLIAKGYILDTQKKFDENTNLLKYDMLTFLITT
jgi:hypothetical protein